MQPELIEAVSHNDAYSKVISAIVEADEQAYVKSHIVIPGLIYGIASGTVANAGIQETLSARISNLILAALDRGRLGMVGDGQAIWPNIHIDDVVDLILRVLDVQLSISPIGEHGRREYYFATNGEHRWYDLSKAIGDAFTHAELARASQLEPSSFSDEELTQYMGSVEMGQQMRHNIRCRSNHGVQLGWRPIRTSEDMFSSIPLQLDAIIKTLLDKQQRPPGPM
ncbi:hypothetical protein QCA50_017983 [Cerrena zonata]|uniref:NAD-dependent epimerase/dehydratase domain-containing protein n=1 Tax=Cerrena zonata TaxID=2478898 RepID=A0AAW0FJA6_9APHY